MSDMAIDMAKLVFGGGILEGMFQQIANPVAFYILCALAFAIFVAIGYVLNKIGNKTTAI